MDNHATIDDAYAEAFRHVNETDARIVQSHIEQAAEVAHEVNRAYCRTLGDFSLLPWSECEEWQRESVIKGVRHAIANRDATPESMHQAWFEHKRAEGWTYGAVKDADRKMHPCMVSFQALPKAQRTKDHLFLAVVRTMCKNIK